jgi:hypothetical protein
MRTVFEQFAHAGDTMVGDATKLKLEGLTSLSHWFETDVQVTKGEVIVTESELAASGMWPDQRQHNILSIVAEIPHSQ